MPKYKQHLLIEAIQSEQLLETESWSMTKDSDDNNNKGNALWSIRASPSSNGQSLQLSQFPYYNAPLLYVSHTTSFQSQLSELFVFQLLLIVQSMSVCLSVSFEVD